MKIILVVLGLVVLVGCQDLGGDYPDYKATTTTPPANGTGGGSNYDRPADTIPYGGRTINGPRDFSCVAGNGVDIILDITNLPVKMGQPIGMPEGMMLANIPQGEPPLQCYHLRGVQTVPGRYHIGFRLYVSQGDNVVWITLTVSEAPRQSVAQ